MVKYLIFLAALSLFLPLACGCATLPKKPAAVLSAPSEKDLYMCGYLKDEDKAAQELKCAPLETFLEYYLPMVKEDVCKPGTI